MAHAEKISQPQLYEIKNKTDKTVVGYLFGTMHLFVNAEDLPGWFWGYFEKADAYAFESIIETDSSLMNKFKEQQGLKKPGSKNLSYILSDKELVALDRYIDVMHKEEKKIFLETKSAFGALNYIDHELYGIEMWKYDITRDTWVTLDEQLEKKVAAKKLRIALDQETEEFFKCEFQTDEVVNIKNLRLLLATDHKKYIYEKNKNDNDSVNSYAGLKKKQANGHWWPTTLRDDCVVTGRNQLWMPKVTEMLKAHKVSFIAVGNAHLKGDEPGLIKLLEKENFEVTLIKGGG